MEDEGRLLKIVMQVMVLNHSEVLMSKALVLSVREKVR
jgi:hypothetical protein